MEELLTSIGTVFTSMMSWTGSVFTTITNNPLLLLMVAGSFALISIGIVRRLLSL